MITPPIPQNEVERLQALYRYQVLDTEAESEFDELVQLASYICDVPISLISLIAEDKQWFKARVGLEATETPRSQAFCAHAIMEPTLFEVIDATKDPRFKDNPLVTGHPDIRFYAGMPLTTPDGYNLGTLCVIDNKPRALSDEQRKAIKTIANQVITQMELRLNLQVLRAQSQQVSESIRYGKRLQEAMLPTEDTLAQCPVQRIFVLSVPKDEISSDFFWYKQIAHKSIVVAADCSGSGIPGALVSVAVTGLLRDIVTHQQITDPSDILYRLDEQMERILRNDSQPYEGMQAVVACINHPQKSIEIASAGNALWTVQNGQATQLPTAPVAIGNSTKAPKRFQKQFLKDIAGTMFYACTDGLTQLPQAENPTFFGQEALPKLLSQVAQQSAGQQKQTIEAAIAQWAGKAPRPDDLLLVGFGI